MFLPINLLKLSFKIILQMPNFALPLPIKWSVGKYKFKVFSEDTSSFYSSSFIAEDIDYENKYTKANHKLLKQISEKSNGTFHNYSEFKLLDEFISKKKFVSKSEIESVNTEDIKKNEWILLILLMLIVTEILIRRTSGKK